MAYRTFVGVACGLVFALSTGCGSSSEGTGSPPAASATGPAASAATSPAGAPASAGASASAGAPAAAAGSAEAPVEGAPPAGTYAGAYKAKVGAMNKVPPEAKTKVWSSDPGTEALGDGTLSLTVVAGKRVVTGEAHGALGDQQISGELDGSALRARVDPNDPNLATAMTGILTGAFEEGGFKGVVRVAGRNGNLVREAAVTLTRKLRGPKLPAKRVEPTRQAGQPLRQSGANLRQSGANLRQSGANPSAV